MWRISILEEARICGNGDVLTQEGHGMGEGRGCE